MVQYSALLKSKKKNAVEEGRLVTAFNAQLLQGTTLNVKEWSKGNKSHLVF